MSILPPLRDLLFFVTAAAVLLVIPGPAVLYIVTRSVDQGRKAGLTSAAGVALGGFLQALAAGLGLSALLASSAVAFAVVKYAGAGYLIYLGIRKFREKAVRPDEMQRVRPTRLDRIFAQGVLVEALNPKTAIFFLAFLPQFVRPERGFVMIQFLMLGLLFCMMGLVSDGLWAWTAGSAAMWLRGNQRFLRSQKYVSGSVYIGLGLVTAASGSGHSLRHVS